MDVNSNISSLENNYLILFVILTGTQIPWFNCKLDDLHESHSGCPAGIESYNKPTGWHLKL